MGFTLYLLVSSADNFCKQFGSRSGSDLFDTQLVFLKEYFEEVYFEKNQQTTKKHGNFPGDNELKEHVPLLGGIRNLNLKRHLYFAADDNLKFCCFFKKKQIRHDIS